MYFVMKGSWMLASELIAEKFDVAESHIPANKLYRPGEGKRLFVILKQWKSPTYIGEFYILT